MLEVRKDIKRNYYCSGACDKCEMGKHYGDPLKGYDTCDEEKLKGLRPIMINAPDRDPKLKNDKFKCEICGNPKLPDEKYCLYCKEYLHL